LTGTTKGKSKSVEFVTLYRPHRVKDAVGEEAKLKRITGGYALTAELATGKALVLLPTDEKVALSEAGLSSKGAIKCRVQQAGGRAAVVGLED